VRTNKAGIDLIKRWESLRLKAYLCPAGVPTIGYGHTEGVKLGQQITSHQADVILDHDLDQVERDVLHLTKGVALNENEFSALVAFAFNVGSDIDDDTLAEGLGDSTLLKKLLGGDRAGAAKEFGKWVWAKDPKTSQRRRLPGLVSRRAAERDLFLRAP
jgi:lysozyme